MTTTTITFINCKLVINLQYSIPKLDMNLERSLEFNALFNINNFLMHQIEEFRWGLERPTVLTQRVPCHTCKNFMHLKINFLFLNMNNNYRTLN